MLDDTHVGLSYAGLPEVKRFTNDAVVAARPAA